MTLPIIFAAIIFTSFAIYKAVLPLVQSSARYWRVESLEADLRQIESLSARKSTLVRALRELEFEFKTNKVSESDYAVFRKKYEREAVQVMKQMDAIHGGRDWNDKLEALIASKDPGLASSIERRIAQEEE